MSDKTEVSSAASASVVVELASRRRRLMCMTYESMLLLGVLAFTVMLPYLILYALEWLPPAGPPGGLVWGHIFLVLGFYFVWYWRRHGQTLAMQTWRLKVVAVADGRNPSLKQACLRYVLSWPSVLLCGVGIVWSLFDLDDLFLHDRLAGTRVVVLPRGKG